MSKPDRLGYLLIVFSVALGLIVGGRAGVICGASGVLIGAGFLTWLILSSTKYQESSEIGSAEAYSAHGKTRILVIVRDAHARQLAESETNNFDLFLNVWLLSETEFDLAIKECQLQIATADGLSTVGQRISGDMETWHLRKQQEEWDMWDTSEVRAVREALSELNTAEPLQVGVHREGWLHFRIQNITAEQFRTASIELMLRDSLFH